MQDFRTEVPLRLSTADGGEVDVQAIVDGPAETWLRSAMAGKQAIEVELRPSEDDDVRAHLGSDQSVIVTVTYRGGEDDDVEGHAMSLRFPSMEAARDFERKLLATGLIAGTVAVSIVGVNAANQQLGSTGGAGAIAGTAPVVQQYAPPAHDMDHELSISLPGPASVSVTPEHVGLTEAAAASSGAEYAPAVRDTDRGDLGAIAPAATSHGYVSAAAASAAAQDPLAMRAGDHGYMSAAAASAAASQDALAMREGDRGYMTAAGAAAASAGSATEEHVGLSELSTGAAATDAPQYAPTVRDTDRGSLATPATNDDEQQRPGDRRL